MRVVGAELEPVAVEVVVVVPVAVPEPEPVAVEVPAVVPVAVPELEPVVVEVPEVVDPVVPDVVDPVVPVVVVPAVELVDAAGIGELRILSIAVDFTPYAVIPYAFVVILAVF
jgi:hypothetical protein